MIYNLKLFLIKMIDFNSLCKDNFKFEIIFILILTTVAQMIMNSDIGQKILKWKEITSSDMPKIWATYWLHGSDLQKKKIVQLLLKPLLKRSV
jgi:hypothetical protein